MLVLPGTFLKREALGKKERVMEIVHMVLTVSQLSLRLARVQMGDMNQGSPSLSRLSILCRIWSQCRNSCFFHAVAAKSLQSCPTLCSPKDGSLPDSLVPGILHARTLEWVATSFSSAGKWKVKEKSLSHIWLLATPWTAAHQAPPSMGFSRQEYWSGLPLPSPQDNYFFRSPEEEIIISSWVEE